MSIVINLLLAVHVIVSLLIILVVLMQRPKNEGLGAAFGSGMTQDIFGAQTTNVLAKFTRWLGGIFFALTLLLSVLYAKHSAPESSIKRQLLQDAGAPPPAAVLPPALPDATPLPAIPAEPAPAEAAPPAVPAKPAASVTPTPTRK